MTHSRVLRGKIEIMRGPLDHAFGRLWDRPDQTRAFPAFLIHLYRYLEASIPLMQAALLRAQELSPTDPVCPLLCDYLAAHVEEERHHDVWALEDLEAAGVARVDRSQVRATVPAPGTASAVGAQYYWIHHTHPICVLGYFAVIEGHPPEAAFIDEMRARSRLPEATFRMMRKHAEVDREHRGELDALLDRMPLQPAHAELLGLSAANTLLCLARGIEALDAGLSLGE